VKNFLVVFDVDSTLIEDEVIELLADRAGKRAEVATVTERAMLGELDFTQSLNERVAVLSGLSDQVLEKVLAELKTTKGAEQLIAAIHAAGGLVGAVSGGFNQLLTPLSKKLNLDFNRANELEVVDAKLTGRVTGKIIDKAAKAAALIEWAEVSGIPLSKTIAVGDGANDLEMMRVAGLSVAFNAKPLVKDRADLVVELQDLAELIPVLGL
jgi:phosphoserine phosphatase